MAIDDRTQPGGTDGEAAYCPECDYEHVRRPDWLCPKCGMPVESAAWRSMVSRRGTGSRAGAEEEGARPFPHGSFVAGAVLVLTGLVLAIGFARDPISDHRWTLVTAMVLLGVIGLELLLKVSWARWVVFALALVALLLVAEDLLRARWPELMSDPLPPPIRAALQDAIRAPSPLRRLLAAAMLAGTLLLVAGRPGRGRLVAGILVASALAVGEIARSILS
jgi:uncharacterized membrane protein SirB2